MTDVDLPWLEALCARHHVSLHARGKRLHVEPKSAYNALLSTEERSTLKAHRLLVLDILRSVGGSVGATADMHVGRPEQIGRHDIVSAPEPPTPAPIYCPFCMRVCVGPAHPAYRDLHHADPLEAQRRAQADADQRLAAALGWPLPHMQTDEPPESDLERQQRAARRQWGWEADGGTLVQDGSGTRRR